MPVRAPQDRLGDAAPGHDRSRWRICAEALLLAVSPAAAFFGLRLTLMAPPDLNDPAMHTTFIIDPHDIFFRYAAVFQPTERLREGARVGFLVPGRIAYLLFGGEVGNGFDRNCKGLFNKRTFDRLALLPRPRYRIKVHPIPG